MDSLMIFAAGIFLPLFPFSMVFNYLYQRARITWLRILMLMIWPLAGLWLAQYSAIELSPWLLSWALCTSLLYSIRALAVKEFNIWVGFIATSAWALSWLVMGKGGKVDSGAVLLIAFSLSLAFLTLIILEIETRFGAAYAGVVKAVAQSQPRLGGIVAFAMLAAIGMPIFPTFFAMLSSLLQVIHHSVPAAFVVVFVWFLWSWSGIRMLQETLAGTAIDSEHPDLNPIPTAVYVLLLVVLGLAGILLSGVLL